MVEQPRKPGAVVERTASGVADDAQTAGGYERVVLKREVLRGRRNARVSEEGPHDQRVWA
jgi:hypothetical protein